LAVPLAATDIRVDAVVPDVTDRPLDEFATADGSDGGSGSERTAAAPSVTMRWSGAGAPCADCGEGVARRWRDGDGDGAFVCADCKDW